MAEWWESAPVVSAKPAAAASGNWWDAAPEVKPEAALPTGAPNLNDANPAYPPAPLASQIAGPEPLNSVENALAQAGRGGMRALGSAIGGAGTLLKPLADMFGIQAPIENIRGIGQQVADVGSDLPTPQQDATAKAFKEGRYADTLGNALTAIPEVLLGSAPDMALMTNPLGMAAETVGRVEQVNQNRLANGGQDDLLGTAQSIAAGVPSALLDRFGLGEMIGHAGQGVAKGLAHGLLGEGSTEGAQNLIEYVGATFGTDKALALKDAIEQFGIGAILGGVTGGTVGGLTGGLGTEEGTAQPPQPPAAPPAPAPLLLPAPGPTPVTIEGKAAPAPLQEELGDTPDVREARRAQVARDEADANAVARKMPVPIGEAITSPIPITQEGRGVMPHQEEQLGATPDVREAARAQGERTAEAANAADRKLPVPLGEAFDAPIPVTREGLAVPRDQESRPVEPVPTPALPRKKYQDTPIGRAQKAKDVADAEQKRAQAEFDRIQNENVQESPLPTDLGEDATQRAARQAREEHDVESERQAAFDKHQQGEAVTGAPPADAVYAAREAQQSQAADRRTEAQQRAAGGSVMADAMLRSGALDKTRSPNPAPVASNTDANLRTDDKLNLDEPTQTEQNPPQIGQHTAESLGRELKARLKQVGIHDAVSARVVPQIVTTLGGKQAIGKGRYRSAQKLIEVALGTPKQGRLDKETHTFVINHEIVHALKDLGLFTPAEWRVLHRAATSDKATWEGAQRYKGRVTDEGMIEEAIADMHGAWVAGRFHPEGAVAKVLTRIHALIDSIRGTFQQAGYKDAHAIFEAIDRGDFGKRLKERTESAQLNELPAEDLVDTEAPASATPKKPQAKSAVAGDKLHTAYHGSPADFDKFSDKFNGTGEGAAAFGYGHYFGEAKGTGETYQRNLAPGVKLVSPTGATYEIKDETTSDEYAKMAADLSADLEASGLVISDADLRPVMKFLFEDGLNPNTKELLKRKNAFAYKFNQAQQDALQLLEVRPRGKLYTVEIPDQVVADMIDGDADVLSSTNQKVVDKVMEQLRQESPDAAGAMQDMLDNLPNDGEPDSILSGQEFYNSVASELGDGNINKASKKKASELFERAGVPGIKYLDQFSRGKQDGTRNLVVFNEDNIEITDKLDLEDETATDQDEKLREKAAAANLRRAQRKSGISQEVPKERNTVQDSGVSKNNGQTPKVDEPTGPAPVFDWTLKDALQGPYEGAAERLQRKPGFEKVGAAIKQFTDRHEALQGVVAKIMDEPLRAASKEDEKQFAEWAQAWNGSEEAGAKVYEDASPKARDLIDAWKAVARKSGDLLLDAKVEVMDPALGKHRLLKRVQRFFPRMLRPEVADAIDNPEKYPKEWAKVVTALIEDGKATDAASAKAYLSRERSTRRRAEVTGDYFAGVEQARGEALPDSLYDYRAAAGMRYLGRWAERLAQIEAFGQKHNEGDIFDKTISALAGNASLRQHGARYLTAIQKVLYKDNSAASAADVAMAWMGQLTTGLMLGNPYTAVRNLIGGLSLTGMSHGAPAARAFIELAKEGKALAKDARDIGVLREDFMRLTADNDGLTPSALSDLTDGLMKFGGYNVTERFVRLHAFVSGKFMLSDALQEWSAHGIETTKGRRMAVWFKRNGFDPHQLLQENGKGPETDHFLRYSVNLAQGSYRLDQVPLLADTPIGRFLFKFQKYGTQLSRLFANNFAKPLVKALALPKGESMRMRDPKTGEMADVQYPRAAAVVDMVRYLGLAAAGGLPTAALLHAIFGTAAAGPDYPEIEKALEDDDTAKATMLGLELAFEGMMITGGFGIIQTPWMMTRDIANQKRAVDITQPPGVQALMNIGGLGMKALDQGKLTSSDIQDFAESTMSLVKRYRQAATYALSKAGVKWDQADLEVQKRQHNEVRALTRRYAEETQATGKRHGFAQASATENTPTNRDIVEAIRLGRPELAASILTTRLRQLQDDGEPRSKLEATRSSAMASVRAQQPIVIGSYSDESRRDFLRWLDGAVTKDKAAEVRSIDKAYRSAANKAGLLHELTIKSEVQAKIRSAQGNGTMTEEQFNVWMAKNAISAWQNQAAANPPTTPAPTPATTPAASKAAHVSSPRVPFAELVDRVEKKESNHNPDAVSKKGAVGTMQTLPATLKDPGYGVTPAKDDSAEERTRVGKDYLKAMLKEFDGNQTHALAAYNWGPDNVHAWLDGDQKSKVPAETVDYVNTILKRKAL